MINNCFFVLSYTLIRVIGFPWMIVIHIVSLNYYDLFNKGTYKNMPDDVRSKHVTTTRHQYSYFILVSFFIAVYCLNLFWYSFVVKGFVKMFKGDPSYDGSDDKRIGKKVDAKATKME